MQGLWEDSLGSAQPCSPGTHLLICRRWQPHFSLLGLLQRFSQVTEGLAGWWARPPRLMTLRRHHPQGSRCALAGWRVPAGVRMHSGISTWMPDWSALSSRSYHRTCLGDVTSSLFLRSCSSEAQRTSVLRATGHGVSPADSCLC